VKLLSGVYEGPQSYGIMRVAASIGGVHALLRAQPGEAYFRTLYGARERTGEMAPVTLSTMREGPDGSMAPGNLARDLSSVVRRHPKTEIVVLAHSEASLLSGETIPVTTLPEVEGTGRTPGLITFPWEGPGMREIEAAELALEDLIRARMNDRHERSPYPTVNLFGPPIFGPGAAAEYAEAERLLDMIGVEVNARVPLGANTADLDRLPRAWANVTGRSGSPRRSTFKTSSGYRG
jgi:light-independent protochlorophyllide reductase subunit B